jgi:pimeloyl-ACP methyl ester carboxylesterase
MKNSTKIAAGTIAATALAGAALFNRSRAAAAERATPPQGKFIEIDGVRLHYVERGDGPPVVLLHGMGALVQDFGGSGLIDALAAQHRVMAFDRPGYGYSARPRGVRWTPEAQAGLIEAALQRLGVERPIVLGHSWGTLPAISLALDFPDEVAGLVLVSGYYFPSARPDPFLLGIPALPGVGPVIANTLSPLAGRASKGAVFHQIFAPLPVPETFERLFPTELALRPGHLAAAAGDSGLLVAAAARLSKRYRELTLPVAILSGKGDRIVSHEGQAERLRGLLPHARFDALEGVGHMLHWIAPDRVVAAVEAVADAAANHPRELA